MLKPHTASAMSVFMLAAPHVNASPISDIFCNCDVSRRQTEIQYSPGVRSKAHRNERKQATVRVREDLLCVDFMIEKN